MDTMFSSLSLGSLKLNNRIIRSATNTYCGNSDGSVSEEQLRIYETLADSRPGLIVTANFSIEQEGKIDAVQNSLGADYTPSSVRSLTDLMHRKDVPVIAQISHAGRKSKINRNAELKYGNTETVSVDEIRRLTGLFRDAAIRAGECGFDGVQIHCGHGYLLSGFTDPDSNSRTDAYGGSAPGRFAFPLEVLSAVRDGCGQDYPVWVKVNSNTASDPESRVYLDDLIYFAGECEVLGIGAIELSGCNFTAFSKDHHNYFESQLRGLRERTSMALILTGGIRSKEDILRAYSAGADLAGLSRPLICEPDFLERLRNSAEERYQSRCLSCNQCFTLYGRSGKHCVLHKR